MTRSRGGRAALTLVRKRGEAGAHIRPLGTKGLEKTSLIGEQIINLNSILKALRLMVSSSMAHIVVDLNSIQLKLSSNAIA